MFDWIYSPEAWVALGTLMALEIVLGIDNIIFISILVGKLPPEQRDSARRIGLGLAMLSRLLLLFSLAWVIGLTEPWFSVFGFEISGRDFVLIVGGFFLLAKSTLYDDGRSDDKSVEPESVCLGRIGSKNIAIIGMERADAFAIYDITNPTAPVFIKMYKTGDAPEGIIFIPASKSPINQSLIVTSNENDGTIKIYKTTKL